MSPRVPSAAIAMRIRTASSRRRGICRADWLLRPTGVRASKDRLALGARLRGRAPAPAPERAREAGRVAVAERDRHLLDVEVRVLEQVLRLAEARVVEQRAERRAALLELSLERAPGH